MFRDLLSKLNRWKSEKRYQRMIELNAKKFYIKLALIQYYNDYNKMNNIVDVPAHIKAEYIMNDVISKKRPSEIDKLYKKSLKYTEAKI